MTVLLPSNPILIIAQSARMLANAAKQAGYRPLVIDLFGDQDTTAIAEQFWRVDDLSLVSIRDIIPVVLSKYNVATLVYGSGMENQPETLAYLAQSFKILGNSPATCQQLNDKISFFKQLGKLSIRYPEVRFSLPQDKTGWLIKPRKNIGGLGISHCDRVATEDEYYQRFYTGQSGSVLFCSDGLNFDLIGWQRQWSRSAEDFSFSGIIRDCILPLEAQQEVLLWLTKLVAEYKLKGLASLDFIWNGQYCYLLEINPRPPASMMLYPELDLFTAHNTGRLRDENSVIPESNLSFDSIAASEKQWNKSIYALQIVYARQGCCIPKNIKWPEWSCDHPHIVGNIPANVPICSIIAQEKTVQLTLDSLLVRQQFIENNLY